MTEPYALKRVSSNKQGGREYNVDQTKDAVTYSRKYLQKNKLGMYLDGYTKLDDIINLFFINYANLNRSSLNCARLWVAVMACRTQLVNAIHHLVDQPRYISVEYRDSRMEELHTHLSSCRLFVAKAVQYIVIFNKHEEEEWRFLRKGFLRSWSKTLSSLIFSVVDAWREFIINNFELKDYTADAYRKHLSDQELKTRIALKNVEPKSKIAKKNAKLSRNLDDLFAKRKEAKTKKDDYLELRVLLATVEDCLGTEDFIQKIDHSGKVGHLLTGLEEEGDQETIIAAKDFLKREIGEQMYNDDKKIWPHQLGLSDLGPFQLVDLPNPSKYFSVLENNQYELNPIYAKVSGMEHFKGVKSPYTQRAKVSFDSSTRSVFGIPDAAVEYSFFFPIPANTPNADLSNAFTYADDFSPLHVICLYGGFGYFDKDSRLISLKGVTMGDDLFFDGPYFLPNPSVFTELQKPEVGVIFAETTLKPIRDAGATGFGWINPGQEGPFRVEMVNGGSSAKGWGFSGAFAYIYNNVGHPELQERRNYFQILTFQEIKLKRQKNANTPIVANLKILYNNYRHQWAERNEDGAEVNSEWSQEIFASTKFMNKKVV